MQIKIVSYISKSKINQQIRKFKISINCIKKQTKYVETCILTTCLRLVNANAKYKYILGDNFKSDDISLSTISLLITCH